MNKREQTQESKKINTSLSRASPAAPTPAGPPANPHPCSSLTLRILLGLPSLSPPPFILRHAAHATEGLTFRPGQNKTYNLNTMMTQDTAGRVPCAERSLITVRARYFRTAEVKWMKDDKFWLPFRFTFTNCLSRSFISISFC